MDGLLRDVGQAVRRLRKSPIFATAAITTLAIGIGANTAIFSLADLIIRRPVALSQMEQLVVVDEQSPGSEDEGISPANYLDLREASQSFEQVAAYQYWSASLSGRTQLQEIHGVRVSANFLSTVGISPMLGRAFLSEDANRGSNEVLISNAFWKKQFGGDPAAVGRTLRLNGEPYRMIGIMPAHATFPLGAPEFWMLLTMDPRTRAERRELTLHTVARLHTGIQVAQARAEVETLWRRLSALYPVENRNRTLPVVSLRNHIVLDYNRQFSFLMLGAAGFVLLIICANIAILQLARGARRRPEIAIRTALGAGRLRLFRQLLAESMILSFAGAVLGSLFAIYGVNVLRRTLPIDVRWFCDVDSLSVSMTGLVFTTCLAVVTGLSAGLIPAWQSSRVAIGSVASEERIVGRGRSAWRAGFVIGETALAMVLLIGAALMVKGFEKLARGPVELSPKTLLTLHLTLPESRYMQPQKIIAFQNQLLERLAALPGTSSVALASGMPYSSYEESSDLAVRAAPQSVVNQSPLAMPEAVSISYFQTMDIPLLEGREFNAGDTRSSLPVCIVSQSTGKRLWPGQNALGKQVRVGGENSAPWITVIGVVGDIQHEIYDRSFRSILYRPYQQVPPMSADIAMRVSSNPLQLTGEVRSAIRELDSDLPVENIQTMSGVIANQAAALQFVAALMGAFGIVALVLAAVGVYGVMASTVTERWREIAIRLALGAQPGKLLATVVGRGFAFAAIGTILGVSSAFVLARALSSLIYGVTSWDTEVFLLAPSMLIAIAILSCYLPARRATRMDTMATLRDQ